MTAFADATNALAVTLGRKAVAFMRESCPLSADDKRQQHLANYCFEIALRPWRRTYFWIFPVAVFGSSVTNVKPCGTLKWAMFDRAKSRNSDSVAVEPVLRTTKAWGASPQCS